MGWDAKASGLYYYHSVKEGGRVRKVYIGRGEQAEKLAHQIEQRRQERQACNQALHQEQDRLAVAEQHFRELCDLAALLVQAVLLTANYYQHKGQWRRRGHGRNSHQEASD
jgi:hypothetical protein